jgi:hypothetical protein
MEKNVIIILFLFVIKFSAAQNLVNNYSFEDYDLIPVEEGGGKIAKYWYSASSTPDYIVHDTLNNQEAKTGNAYIGMFVYNRFNLQTNEPTSLREYIGTNLKYPLIAAKEYYVEINVLLPSFVSSAISTLGIYFSYGKITTDTGFLNLIPQVENNIGELLDDRNNWHKVVANYKANGGESFITLGNFKEDSLCGFSILNQDEFVDIVYYYIDDVLVVDVDSLEFLTTNVKVPKEEILTPKVQVFPNPIQDYVIIKVTNSQLNGAELVITDLLGRTVAKQTLQQELTTFSTQDWANGMYVWSLVEDGRLVRSGKLVKE